MKALILCMLLAGCATQFRPPATVEVDKPVLVKCATSIPVRPNYRTEHLLPSATDLEYADALILDWIDAMPYEALLRAGLEACK